MPRLNPLRHQLASTSPVRLRGLFKAAMAPSAGSESPSDPRTTLREMLCKQHGVSDAVLSGSGTEGVVLAFETAERLVGRPTTVVLPAFSCFDVAAAAVRFGRPVVFYDVDPHTLGPDPDSLRLAASGGDRTVLVASLFGIPIDWRTIDPILTDSGAFVVEDAAQGHGATWEGKPLGSHGRLGVLSFGRGKGWTGGSGGALLFRDRGDRAEANQLALGAAAAGKARILAKAAAHWALGRPSVYGLPRAIPALGLGETRYREVGPPQEMSPSAAALALDTKGMADEWIEGRRTAAANYFTLLDQVGLTPDVHVPGGSEPGYGRFPLLLAKGMGSFGDPAAATRLGAVPSYPAPLPDLDRIQRFLARESPASMHWPGARTLVEQLVTLPTHPLAHRDERGRLVKLLSQEP